jgi:hypothetical protein
MTPELLAKIESLVEAGAMIIGAPPRKSPSLVNYPQCDQRVRAISERLWGGLTSPAGVVSRPYGRGRIYWGGELSATAPGELYPGFAATAKVVEAEGVRPDLRTTAPFRYAHVAFPDREIYFVSNRTGEKVTGTVFFREGTRAAELWNAVTGEIVRLPARRPNTASGAEVTLHLDAFQSGFVVFYKDGRPAQGGDAGRDEIRGREKRLDLNGPWSVAFDPRWGGPEQIEFDDLSDWSRRPEDGIRYYSGIAQYKKTFDLPEAAAAGNVRDWILDVGIVKNLARVRLNGRDLGVIWTAPWEVRITGAVRPKGNQLEIEVVNLWINRLIGDERFPDDGVKDGRWPEWLLDGTPRPSERFTFTTHRFYKKDDPLQPSGLIGPVTIWAVG